MIKKSISLAKLHHKNSLLEMRGVKNVLGLKHPERYSCQITAYQADYGQMFVRISESSQSLITKKRFNLYLKSVAYFIGPFEWEGANFQLLNIEENYEMMKKIPQFKGAIDSDKTVTSFVVRLIGSQEYDVYISAIEFILQFEDYMPEFVDGILLP
jgi:hypothetical protein